MPEPTPSVTTGEPVVGSPEGSPAAATPPVGTVETVEKARFDGLMSAKDKMEADLKRQIAELQSRVQAPAPAVAPVPAVTPDEVKRLVDEARGESHTVYNLFKQGQVATLVEKYPYARPEDAQGTTPEEWAANIKAAHERVAKYVEDEKTKAKQEAEAEAAKRFGVPLSAVSNAGAPLSDAAAAKAKLNEAVESKDPVAAAKALLLLPQDDQ